MFTKLRSKSGFTLMELLVVLIIVGVLAAIGIPAYLNQVEKARAKQAYELLGAYREAQVRYSIGNATGTYATTTGDLDVQGPAGGRVYWTFGTTATTNTAFTINASRDAGSRAGNTITLNESGMWGGTYTELVPQN